MTCFRNVVEVVGKERGQLGQRVEAGQPEPLKEVRGGPEQDRAGLEEVLLDQRAVGHLHPDALAVEAMERENLRVLDDLAKGGRVAVEA